MNFGTEILRETFFTGNSLEIICHPFNLYKHLVYFTENTIKSSQNIISNEAAWKKEIKKGEEKKTISRMRKLESLEMTLGDIFFQSLHLIPPWGL